MELARWITPPLPWAPLDEDGNDVPVYLGVSTVYCQRISVVDNFCTLRRARTAMNLRTSKGPYLLQ
jgi:hypothetical protein